MTIVNQKTVGVIGLGAMGQGIATVLLRKGFEVIGCDIQPQARERLAEAGGTACEQPEDVGRRCTALIVFVVNAAQTEEVLFGAHGAAAHMKAGSVVIVCSTTQANFITRLGQRLAGLNLLLLDTPVTGGIVGANEGTLTALASGPEDAFQAAEGVLRAFSSRIYRFGAAHGQGTKAKIVNQLLVGVHIAAAAEAMAFAQREGLDPDQLYDAIRHGAGNSWAFGDRVPRMVAGSFDRQTALDIFVKDLALVLETARSSVSPTPLAATAYQMFATASASGWGQLDDSAVIKIFPFKLREHDQSP